MWKNVIKGLGIWSVCALVGCIGTEPEAESAVEARGDVCEQAAAHVSACLGEQIAADPSCNAQDAQALIDQSCDSLRRQTADGKGDLMCNPIFFWTKCNRGIDVNLTVCQEEGLCDWSDGVYTQDSCFTYQIKDSQGRVVVEETTRGGNHLMTEDLDDGDYTIEVLNRDGTIAPLMQGRINTLSGIDYSNDLDGTFTIEKGRSDSHTLYLPLHKDDAGDIHQCGSLQAQVQLFCDGEVYRDSQGQWDWYATMTPTSTGAWISDEEEHEAQPFTLSAPNDRITNERYEQSMSLDVFRKNMTVFKLSPGTYELDFYYIEHDGSEFNADSSMAFDDKKFKDFVRRAGYMSGHKETRTVELRAEDFESQFGMAQRVFEISYPSCPR